MAKCPMCKGAYLHLSTYEENLPVNECPVCGGAWLRANEYAVWLKTQTPGSYDLEGVEELNISQQISDSQQAAFCPDCGHFLRSYQVEIGIGFHLDRCNNCNGVWLDRNEWQVLKSVDLHDEINRFFTQPWQRQIQDQETTKRLDAIFAERFGNEDYTKVKEVRNWLEGHRNRNTLLAFLMDDDPYKA
ncbi:MAG: zf-TFIIB domain-containing protein [Anaerolineales bacterium]